MAEKKIWNKKNILLKSKLFHYPVTSVIRSIFLNCKDRELQLETRPSYLRYKTGTKFVICSIIFHTHQFSIEKKSNQYR